MVHGCRCLWDHSSGFMGVPALMDFSLYGYALACCVHDHITGKFNSHAGVIYDHQQCNGVHTMKSNIMRYVLNKDMQATKEQEIIEVDFSQIKDTVALNLEQFGETVLQAALVGGGLTVKHQAYARTKFREREQIQMEIDGKPSVMDGKAVMYDGAYVNSVAEVQAYAPTIKIEYGEGRGDVEQEIDKRVEALEPAERTLKALRKIEKDVRGEAKKAKDAALKALAEAKASSTEKPTGHVRKAKEA